MKRLLLILVLGLVACIKLPPCVYDGTCFPRPRVTATAAPTTTPTVTPHPVASDTFPGPTVTATIAPPTPNPNKIVTIAYFDNGPKGGRVNVCGKDGNQPCVCGPGGNTGVKTTTNRTYRCIQWDSTLKVCRDMPACNQAVPCDTDHPDWYNTVCNFRDYDSAHGPTVYKSSTGELLPSGYGAWVEVPISGFVEVTTCTSVPHVAADGTTWPVYGNGCHSKQVTVK